MKVKFRKLIVAFLFGMGMTVTGVLGYATVNYVMNKTVDESAIVGETAIYTDGLIIELESYDTYTLTFFELEETESSKHYITYIYNYTVLVDGMDIEVSSLSDDIVVSNLTPTETTISITFSLNQEKEFNNGDILNIQFYFEAVAKTAININTATEEELSSVGFTVSEAGEIVALGYNVASLDELYSYVYIADITTRFEALVNDGIIVFE